MGTLCIYNVKQRQINSVCFNVDKKNAEKMSKQRCHFQRRFSQRWAASKLDCEYDHFQKE